MWDAAPKFPNWSALCKELLLSVALEFRDLLIKCTEIKILSAKIGRTQDLQPNLSKGGRPC